MDIKNYIQIGIDLEKYAYLVDSFGVTKASSITSSAKMFGLTNILESNRDLFNTFDRNNLLGSKISTMDSIARDYEVAVRPFGYKKSHLIAQFQDIQKSINSMLKPIELLKMHSITSSAKMFGLTNILKSNRDLFNTFDRNSIWGDQLRNIDLQSQIANFISMSSENLLEEMMNSMQNQPIAVLNTDYTPSSIELATATEILYEETEQQSFIERFNKLPVYLQILLIQIIINFVLPVMQNIVANLATTEIQKVLNLDRNDTDKIRIIQKLPSKITYTKLDISHLRFITAKSGLHVRTNPSLKKSKVKDTIYLGKIVEVLEKRKNWIKISYKKENGIIKGWVITRYTKKFVQ